MKTDCIFRSRSHTKLSPLASTPNVDDLKQLLTEVRKRRNCSIELPWAVDMVRFSLDVRINLGSEEPIWTLYQGDGLESHVVWGAPFTDIYLLREVVAISIAEIVLEHKQEKLRENAERHSIDCSQTVAVSENSSSSAHLSMAWNIPEDSNEHSYRNMENSLASVADMVNDRVSRIEQRANKIDKAPKHSEQLLNIAEESINKAEQSINKAEQSINKAEQSINKAEQSINKAEQSINKVEQIIEDISETSALASTVLHSVAKQTVSEMTENYPNLPSSSPYSYSSLSNSTNNPSLVESIALAFPASSSAAQTTNNTKATGEFPIQSASNANMAIPVAKSLAMQGTAQAALSISNAPTNSPNNPRASSIRLAPTDDRLLDKQITFPLGQFLVESGIIPKQTLDMALKLQKMVGGNVISSEQAINTIRHHDSRNGKFDMVQLIRNSKTGGNKINNPDYPLLGQLLVKAAIIDDPTLEAALKMQEVVRGGAMSKDKACEILKHEFVASGRIKCSIGKAEQVREQKALDLLIEAGLINKEDKTTAKDVQMKFGGKIGEILVSAHKLSETAYKAALECEQLICQNKIKLEETVIALNYCERSRVNLTDAMQELGFQIET